MVIYSCTRSNSEVGSILTDTRRLNVAVSRVKAKLVTLARDHLPIRRVKEFLGATGWSEWNQLFDCHYILYFGSMFVLPLVMQYFHMK